MRIAPIAEIKAQFSSFVKAAEESPVIVTKNGKPVAVLLGITDEDEIERLVLAYSRKLRTVLDAAEQRIRESGGMTHEEVWREVDAAYTTESTGKDKKAATTAPSSRRRRSAPKTR